MTHAVVTTTIYPPENLRHWAQSMEPDDVLVVSGDRKAPHEDIQRILDEIQHDYGIMTVYAPGFGNDVDWKCASVIGWDSIQRRNIAILEAMRFMPDFITTVDTDNYPIKPANHLAEIRHVMNNPNAQIVSSRTGWFNVGSVLSPPVSHRGFPLTQRRAEDSWRIVLNDTDEARVGVHASFWEGDPDIDAIERIHSDPQTTTQYTKRVPNFILSRETWCPFNSQSTTYRRELLPLLFVIPHIGRMDDIWASYIARAVMDRFGWDVLYGYPNVIQERHPHDLVKDLENEIIGYRHTENLVHGIRNIDLSSAETIIEALRLVTFKVGRQSFMPPPVSLFFDKWLQDLDTLRSHYSVSFE